jgi:hypothetical protein
MRIRNMKKEFGIQTGIFDLFLRLAHHPFSCDRYNEFASKTGSPGDIASFWRPPPDKRDYQKLAFGPNPARAALLL